MNRDLFTQLKREKHSADFGAVTVVEKESSKARVLAAIGHVQKEQRESVAVWFITIVQQVRLTLVSLPAMGVAAALVLALGGSLTTVSAGSSLPGDALYSVKLATERAQIKLASQERRVLLRTEFAERRLEEAAELTRGGADQSRTDLAISGYNDQIAHAKEDLESLKQESPEQAAKIASAVDVKLDDLNAKVKEQTNESVIESTNEASQVVVDVIVDAKEKEEVSEFAQGEVINDQIEELYRKRLNAATDRQAYDFGRLARIERWYLTSELEPSIQITVLKLEVEGVSDKLYQSMTLLAQGGYRTAFDLIEETEIDLKAIESELAAEENTIIELQTQQIEAEIQ